MTATAREQTIADLRRRMDRLTDRLGQRGDGGSAAAAPSRPARTETVDPASTTPTGPGRALPTLPGLTAVPPLRAGAVHRVDNLALALALAGGASQAGGWLGVLGVPELGYEAAAELGVELGRTIVIPEPGERWAAVLAELAEVTEVVLVRPPGRVSAGQAERLRARLRLHGTALLSCGPWPRCEVGYGLRGSRWFGVGRGDGHLRSRRAEIEVTWPGRPEQHVEVWLPGDRLRVGPVVPEHDLPGTGGTLADHDRPAERDRFSVVRDAPGSLSGQGSGPTRMAG